jgi:hypothetical protein
MKDKQIEKLSETMHAQAFTFNHWSIRKQSNNQELRSHGGYFDNSNYDSLTIDNLSRTCFLITSLSRIIISTFSFLFWDTTFVFRYSRLPKSSEKRLSKIHMQTWQLPSSAASLKRSRHVFAASALRFWMCF